jgi:ADP-ribosyl-[dinitrogen reductase] hydrolase
LQWLRHAKHVDRQWAAGGSLEALVRVATQQAVLTHHDPHSGYGAAIHAAMIRAGIRGEDVFDGIEIVLDVLPAAARERWASLLAFSWQPDCGRNNGTVWACLAEAVWAVRNAATLEEAVVNAVDLGRDADTVACVTGGIAGARWGARAIPRRLTTYLNGTVAGLEGETAYDYATLQAVARRPLGKQEPEDLADEPAGGPTRVHDSFPIYAANRAGAAAAPDDWQVISLCRTGEASANRKVRRQVFLVDKAEQHPKESLLTVLTDVVRMSDALIAEDASRPILVHCHGGRSRTAFVLKGWAMRRFGWTEEQAHAWLQKLCPRIDRVNE